MKQFFKFFFASMLGFIVGSVVLVFLFIAIVAGIAASATSDDDTTKIKEKSILELSFNYLIPERSSDNPFDDFDLVSMKGTKNSGLNDILKSIQSAADDEKIKGIYLNLSVSPNSYATLEEIRDALIAFKKSGKFIYAYAEVMEEHSYYLASVADQIYLNPAGEMVFDGFSYNEAYLKNMLDKIGVEPQLIRHGKYKAAGEPLIANEMSNENKQQIEAFMGSLYQHFIAQIAKARKKQPEEVMNIANNLLIQSPDDALKLGMITGIKYRDELMDEFRKKIGVKDGAKIDFVTLGTYAKHAKDKNNKITSKQKIALVYADGSIMDGESDDETIGSVTFCQALEKARNDSSVKAIVLRINSPGGSALASDVMWREVILAKKVKPVVVSFGSVAASGGYYIAAPADKIFAQPNTITGSIGVFAVLMNAQKLLKDKLGINMQTVNFGKYADIGNASRPLSADEKVILQKAIDRIYTDFTTKVAEGRSLTLEHVDSIAQGRVYSGNDAMTIGLVDEIGSLQDAIAYAAKKANMDEYRILSLPENEDTFKNLLKSITSESSTYLNEMRYGEFYPLYQQVNKALQYKGIQTRMPFSIEIN